MAEFRRYLCTRHRSVCQIPSEHVKPNETRHAVASNNRKRRVGQLVWWRSGAVRVTLWHTAALVPDHCLPVHISSPKMLCASTVVVGLLVATYTSSRKATKCSRGPNLSATAHRPRCCPRLKRRGINGSPCSPPSPVSPLLVCDNTSLYRPGQGLCVPIWTSMRERDQS